MITQFNCHCLGCWFEFSAARHLPPLIDSANSTSTTEAFCRGFAAKTEMRRFGGLADSEDLTGQVQLQGIVPLFNGNYSCVYKGNLKGREVAVKIIRVAGSDESTRRKVRRERDVWRKLDHPNILGFDGYANDFHFQPFGALISPWCSNGDLTCFLADHGPSLAPFQRIGLWEGVLQGVAYLHGMNPPVIHGDLKPGNVLIGDDGKPKICDFGLVRIFLEEGSSGMTTTTEHTGTERYLSPELVVPDQTVFPTLASDIYALGCLGLVIIYMQQPHSRHKNNMQGRVLSDIKRGVPPASRSVTRLLFVERPWVLISLCSGVEPKSRPAASILVDEARCIPYLTSEPLACILRLSSNEVTPNEWQEDHSVWSRQVKRLKELGLVSKTWQAHALSLLQATSNPVDGTRPEDVPLYTWQQLQKSLSDHGQEVDDTQVFTWRITNWGSLARKMTSPEFPCGGFKWEILLHPLGNSSALATESVSIYLKYAGPKASDNWHACAQFGIMLSNPNDPKNFILHHAHHRFIPGDDDWGFTRFTDRVKLFQPNDNNARPIIENNDVTLTVIVRVFKDPTGVLWHNFVNYDSKKETGYVGLKNQGATAYMNVILQLLYSIRYLRKAVYQVPTENDAATESTALALQRVFYFLQTGGVSVSTHELTKSFGWKSLDSFMAHDAAEFNRVLQDKLESIMKGTPAEGAINRIFVGKMTSFIRCINVEFESSRSEEFYDIELNVKGMRSLRESLQNYIAVSTLEGEDKYLAEGYGYQDARMGVIFQSFPPVLVIRLKRYHYDGQTDGMVKVYDRLDFPFEIDLEAFLDQSGDRSEPHVYRLHAVVVHSGDLHNGHNFAFIKPDSQTSWLKFDDDRVIRATRKEAIENNYGSEPTDGLLQQAQVKTAYMLVYIRKSRLGEMLGNLAKAEIPPHLEQMDKAEQREADRKRREREEQHLYLTIKIVTETTFQQYQGFDLATFEDRSLLPSELPSFRVLKQEPYLKFKARLAQAMELQTDRIRLWVMVHRQNKTLRPDLPRQENDSLLTVESVRNKMATRSSDLRLFLDIRPEQDKAYPEPNGNTLLIFLKYFDANKQQLCGVGKVYVPVQMKVGDLSGDIYERMLWSSIRPALVFFEEIKPGMINPLQSTATFGQSEIQDGDIVCFQVEISKKDIADLEVQGLASSPVAFYDFLQNRIVVHFRRKDEADTEAGFDLTLSKKMTYDMMSQKVGDHLKHEHYKLRFTTTLPNGQPKQVLKRSLNQAVSEIIQPNYIAHQALTILYELLDVSISELETKRSLKIVWMGQHNKEEATFPFLLPKTTFVAALAEHVAKIVATKPLDPKQIRLFSISKDGKRQEELGARVMIGDLIDGMEVYAEISIEEKEAEEGDQIISAYHFYREPTRAHGVPFRVVCKPNEVFSETKKRLAARLQVPAKDWVKFRFALIQGATFKQPTYIGDDDCLYDHQFFIDDVLGLDHIDKSGRRADGAYKNEALVIKG